MSANRESNSTTTDNNDAKGEKRALENEVQSANEWEKADLGDEERKNKFLRLMGGAKKEHHGKFVIGENKTHHGKTEEEVEKTKHDLEEQFTQSLEHKLSGAARKHVGIGFNPEADTHKDSEPIKDKTEEKTEKSEETDKDSEVEVKDNLQEEIKKDDNAEPPKKKAMMMNFVKASSDS
ncbi:unnamed protein product [Owenia fusiformis]|uniref:Small acidic protein n=1 Tax=Owenia fusiformis TaxID=6347 RepID=A0A8J1TBK5_OWEFU|nr:unnamed protein product [Owenia fusiformis]